jgi:CheY-like chemotaxis protein
MSVSKSPNRIILVADDDIDDQEMISGSLQDMDHKCQVEVVSDGQQVIDRLEDNSRQMPCLVVLDLNMPILDGMETLSRIRQKSSLQNIPVVVFTTSDSGESRKQSLKLGAMDYIVKPNDYAGLMDVTAKMMEYCSV